MKKKTIIFIIIITIIVLTLSFYFGIKFFDRLAQEKGRIRPIIPEEEKPKPLTVEELKERLLKDAEPIVPDILLVLESEKEGAYGNPRFEIEYQKPFDLFLISLLDKPLDEVRKEAEKALLEKAGGELEALCQLNVLVSSPYFVSEEEIVENPEVLEICLTR